jgi:hypothetical protein
MQIGVEGEGPHRWHLGGNFSCSDCRYDGFIPTDNGGGRLQG